MSRAARPRGLGRGLDALLPSAAPESSERAAPHGSAALFLCAIEKIVPCRSQPRTNFDVTALDELAESIRTHGLLEPLVVRRLDGEDRFEIVAGERRWRASQRAGLREVPVHLKDVDPRASFELALIENVQREDLNPIEFAEALGRLVSEHGHTQETLAALLHRDRSTLANALRLLKLPQRVRELIIDGQLSEGHGRALLGCPDEKSLVRLAEKTTQEKLSVRQVEALVRSEKKRGSEPSESKTTATKSAGVRDLETRLARRYGARCEVRDRKGRGEIVIRYADLDDLDRILEHLLP